MSMARASTSKQFLSIPTPLTLRIPDFRRVNLTLVGCGGTGSHLASGLVALVEALAGRGVAADVLFVDPDIVEPANVGRQLFGPGDVGRAKAEVLAGRLNAAFGTRVGAVTRHIDAHDTFCADGALNVAIGAVDNPRGRRLIARQVKRAGGGLWWLDCGNENHSGQVALGNVEAKAMKGAIALGMVDRLPAPHVVYPDLVRTQRRNGKAVSCAELAAAGEQGLMVNRVIAAWALVMLHDFLVTRELRYFAIDVDLAWAGVRARAIDEPTLREILR